MTMATKAGLLGMWRIDRPIVDALGPDAHFTGNIIIRQTEGTLDTLTLAESGYLKIGDQSPVPANRAYSWVFHSPTFVEAFFLDGRPFHNIDLATANPKALHECPPDTYRVAYDFRMPDEWRSTWTVTGPRKDYVMTSTMTRPRGWKDRKPTPKGPATET